MLRVDHLDETSCSIALKVTPGARCDGVIGVYGDVLKVAVASPPEHGQANAAVQRVLARWLELKPNQVELVSGLSSSRKRVRLAASAETVTAAAASLGTPSANAG